jgi:hypothetical protein
MIERRPAVSVSPGLGGEAALDRGDGVRLAIGRPRARGAGCNVESDCLWGGRGPLEALTIGLQPSKCFLSEAYARRC